jgi:hypothetical protein
MNQAEINMIDLMPGIYFYSIFINGKLTDTKKMIIK